MLYKIAAVLTLLWLLGVMISFTMLGFIHILVFIAAIMVIVRLKIGHQKQSNKRNTL